MNLSMYSNMMPTMPPNMNPVVPNMNVNQGMVPSLYPPMPPAMPQNVYANQNSNPMNNTHNVSDRVICPDYLQRLKEERQKMDNSCQFALKLLDAEIFRCEKGGDQYSHIEVKSGHPTRMAFKIKMPDDYETNNYAGRLLGPKGSTLKQLQEETGTRISINGRGSCRDPKKEQELFNTGEEKYKHLLEPLHVTVDAFAAAPEALRRCAFAMHEIRKFFLPEYEMNIKQQQGLDTSGGSYNQSSGYGSGSGSNDNSSYGQTSSSTGNGVSMGMGGPAGGGYGGFGGAQRGGPAAARGAAGGARGTRGGPRGGARGGGMGRGAQRGATAGQPGQRGRGAAAGMMSANRFQPY